MERLITHLAIPEYRPLLPGAKTLRKLYFYTKDPGIPNEYYWGVDNYPFDEEAMGRKSVIRLPEEIELTEKRGLWIDMDANIFYADLVNPNRDPEKRLLFTSTELFELNKKLSQ